MRVMVMGKANVGAAKDAVPTVEAFAAMDKFTEELAQAGVLVAGAGLKNDTQGKRITIDGDKRVIVDGRLQRRASSSPAFRSGRSRIWTRRWRG
jgi:hypothetical protein